MRMLMTARMPHEPFNKFVREGTVGAKVQKILAEAKAEAVYFTEMDGHRGCIMIVEVADPTRVPVLAEPWFLTFNADVSFHIVMSPEDLAKSGIDGIGKKW